MGNISIRRVIEHVSQGQIRIPAFQRGFVWDAERVAFLMDSIYKSYPFGSLILWQTKNRLTAERKLGPFKLPESQAEFPIQYVLDGQQRLTSIFGVFQSDLVPDGDDSWTQIFFDLSAADDFQESQFLALDPSDVDPARHFPISTFFDVTGYRKATENLTTDQAELIDSVQSVFKEALIPTQDIVTDNRAKVAIVFERVNRLGVELDVLQLLTAWTWSEDFDLQSRFSDLAQELAPFGFGDVGDDSNLLLRCCAAVVAGDASPATLIRLNGAEVRENFERIENGIKGAIDFVRTHFHVERLVNLPYPALLVPLTVFFASMNGKSLKVTDFQRETLVRWFWRACFSRRFSAGVLRNLKRDIDEIAKLRAGAENSLSNFSVKIDAEHFTERQFSISAVDSKTFILMLVQASPLSFVSGSPVSLKNVLQSYNRSEFHHLLPRAFLGGRAFPTEKVNALANFAMISASDNKTLGGVAPSVYRTRMPETKIPAILAAALCPNSLFDDDYDSFISARAQVLAAKANSLVN
ncbi:hypothetical protein IWX64_002635 [Arthrobacter sp. CAN_A212]|uniref:GmrSD restriction endonuclease domain-containing protein n=1 Tax=Arthrobacter sp. CAN_A212 TaxID=2787719 RepID=UPI0018CAD973